MTQVQLLAQLHTAGRRRLTLSAGSLSAWLASKVQTQRTSTWFADAARAFWRARDVSGRRPGRSNPFDEVEVRVYKSTTSPGRTCCVPAGEAVRRSSRR